MEDAQFIEIMAKCSKLRRWGTNDLASFVGQKLIDISRSKGYESTHSKKARAFFATRCFMSEEDGTYFVYKIGKYLKEPRFESMSFHMHEIKTSGGTVYVQPGASGDGLNPHIAFTAHLFDRYKERAGIDGNRKKAMKSLVSEIMVDGFVADSRKFHRSLRDGKGPVVVYTKTGMMLGEMHVMQKEGTDELASLILYKTFVSNSMLRSGQSAALKDSLAKIAAKVDAGEDVGQMEKAYLKNYIETEIRKYEAISN